jgi:hypothetical protein
MKQIVNGEWRVMNFEPVSPEGAEESLDAKPQDIRSRSFDYALRAIKLYQHLQAGKDGGGWVLGKQYLRSACSVGANIEEAQASESRADFCSQAGDRAEGGAGKPVLASSLVRVRNRAEESDRATDEGDPGTRFNCYNYRREV